MSEDIKGNWDLVIVGGGVCGLSAALIATQNQLRTLVLDQSKLFGGQLTEWIEYPLKDIPAMPLISAPELAKRLIAQVKQEGVIHSQYKVVQIQAFENHSLINLNDSSSILASRVLICTGVSRRNLGIEGEEIIPWGTPHTKFDRTGTEVLVVGGGDEACSSTKSLVDAGAKVTLVVRNQITARRRFIDPIIAHNSVEILKNDIVIRIRRSKNRFLFELKSGRKIEVDEGFIRIGFKPVIPKVTPSLSLSEDGMIQVDNKGRTSISVIYAGGDVTRIPSQRYVNISMADGVKAARAIADDLVL